MDFLKKFVLLPMSKKQLAAWFKVSPKTLDKWLKPYLDLIGPRNGYYFQIPQLLIILEVLTGMSSEKLLELARMGGDSVSQ